MVVPALLLALALCVVVVGIVWDCVGTRNVCANVHCVPSVMNSSIKFSVLDAPVGNVSNSLSVFCGNTWTNFIGFEFSTGSEGRLNSQRCQPIVIGNGGQCIKIDYANQAFNNDCRGAPDIPPNEADGPRIRNVNWFPPLHGILLKENPGPLGILGKSNLPICEGPQLVCRYCKEPSEKSDKDSSNADNRPLVVVKDSSGLFDDESDSAILGALFLSSVFILATVIATSPMSHKRPRQDGSGKNEPNRPRNHD
jgi:hypothetical protein